MLRLSDHHDEQGGVVEAGRRHLGDAADAGADCLVTPCPLCHLDLDLQQPLAERSSAATSDAGPAPAPARRARAGAAPVGARAAAPCRQADVGDRLDDVGGRPGGRCRRRWRVGAALHTGALRRLLPGRLLGRDGRASALLRRCRARGPRRSLSANASGGRRRARGSTERGGPVREPEAASPARGSTRRASGCGRRSSRRPTPSAD